MRPKIVVGRRVMITFVCPSQDGAERQNPLGYFTDGARDASFGRALPARRFKSAFERWPRYRGPTNMRRVRVVLQVAIGGAAASRRHTQAGDDDGAHHSPRPLVKTRRYETPVAPARQSPPKPVDRRARQSSASGSRRARRRAAPRQLSRPNPRGRAEEPHLPRDPQRRGARERQARQTGAPVAGKRHRARAAGADRRGRAATPRAAGDGRRA